MLGLIVLASCAGNTSATTDCRETPCSVALKVVSRRLFGTMFVMASSETLCTSRGGPRRYSRCTVRGQNLAAPSGLCSLLRRIDQQAPLARSPPSSQRMLTSSGLQPTTAKPLQPPWTGSPAPVDRVAGTLHYYHHQS